MEVLANLNGQLVPLHEAKISALDRGFLFGDGVYEAVRIYNGKPFLFKEHLDRLARSADALRITCSDKSEIKQRADELIQRSGEKEASLYIQITRGAASVRKHAFPAECSPTEFMFVMPFVDSLQSMRTNGCSVILFPDIRWKRRDIKSINLLGNVLAAQAAKEAGAYEAVLVDDKNEITEGALSNVFAVSNGKLRTYPLSHDILPGVTRELVIKLARKNSIPVEEKVLTKLELLSAEEVFLSGTTSEILPVTKVDSTLIANGSPGNITRTLQKSFRECLISCSAENPSARQS